MRYEDGKTEEKTVEVRQQREATLEFVYRPATGSLRILTVTAGTVVVTGTNVNRTAELPAGGSLPVEDIYTGSYRVTIRYEDGKTEEKTVEVRRSREAKLAFNYRPAPLPEPAPPKPSRPAKEKPPQDIDSAAYRLNTLGGSVGTTFAAPVFVGTVQGTYAPWKSSFFELGVDIGAGSGYTNVGYFSLYPYARYAYFVPFAKGGGWYAGAGAGLMIATYAFPEEGKTTGNFPAADLSTGFIFGSGITLFYSLRTDFVTTANSKLGAGWSYRFK
jgi:hypothetical protein